MDKLWKQIRMADLRQQMLLGDLSHGIIMLIAADAQSPAAVIDSVAVPSGAGGKEFARLPTVWLQREERGVAQ